MPEPIVLVIDDEANVVLLCRRLLERAGFQVLVSTNPTQGLAILERQPVDLMLADIRMPELDGFQLLTLARRKRPDLAAVIMTGYGTVDTAIAALKHGADGLILKPFTNDELVENVQRALRESQHKRDAAHLQALKPLFGAAEKLFSETDLDQLRKLIIQVSCQYLDCTSAGLYNYVEEEGAWGKIRAQGDWLPDWIGKPDEDRLGFLASQETPIIISNNQDLDEGFQAFLAEHNLCSLVGVPINHKDTRCLLVIGRSLDEYPFRPVEQEMALILARQAVAALENAGLYSELRLYVEQVDQSRRAMIQAEKVAAAGRMTASIAHEINNPLQSLSNFLHLAGRRELETEARQRFLRMAQNELDRLMATVQRMLEFYRPGAIDRKATSINSIVQHVVRLMEPQFAQNGIQVHVQLAPDLPLIMGVANQLQQVFINLLINSMEAMPDGGEVTIETTSTCIEDYKPGLKSSISGVEILVGDTGPGIPEREQERVFEPFYSTKENGTGLGLAVSYGIIAAHGGSLNIVNGRCSGACFRILLPEEEIYESQNISG